MLLRYLDAWAATDDDKSSIEARATIAFRFPAGLRAPRGTVAFRKSPILATLPCRDRMELRAVSVWNHKAMCA